MPGVVSEIFSALTRRKPIDPSTLGESRLARVLNVFDLTALGVGSTLGAGVYVLTGAVAKEVSGPSVVIAFLIAAIASVLSGLCYAEFGARVPKAGSGYVYSYVTVGELCAFVIGWNLVLAYIIGSASVAKAWGANFDVLIDGKIEKTMLKCCKMDSEMLAPYPDFFALLIVALLTALIAFGAKEFALVNKIFTVLNVCVIVFVVVAGFTYADPHNWALSPEEIVNISQQYNMTNVTLTTYGSGGFMPYGFSGLISGTATCFYAFIGFDCIATTGEEAKNPQRSIPLGIVFSLIICCIAYLGISSALTLMQPYFLLDEDAPLPLAFEYVGMEWAVYPVSIGAICALSTSLLGSMFPMPRIIYAMAIDGLLFRTLSRVNKRTKTPMIATLLSGAFAGIMAMLFELKELVDLMSIGTLTAYTLVASSVLVLRYRPSENMSTSPSRKDMEMMETTRQELLPQETFSIKCLFVPSQNYPTKMSSVIVNYSTAIIAAAMIMFSAVALIATGESGWSFGSITFACIFGFVISVCLTVIAFQPQSQEKLSFSVPFLPFIPITNMMINIYLMVSLPPNTWYKLAVWLVLGGLIYFLYGVWHSNENPKNYHKRETAKVDSSVDEEEEETPLAKSNKNENSTHVL